MSISDCIFCKIASGQIPTNLVYHDEEISAFNDAHPKAPVHILIIPNRHITSLNRAVPEDAVILGKMILKAKDLAKELGVNQSGYRLVINTGPDAGQSVFHVHLHLLGGRRMPIGFE
jgi:histidine triad (HIT) family protein